ncbi:L-threonine-0-3-phosphate decarboxylase, cobalt-precorrin-3 C17-methyltransferase and adenosylcobyric acid synthase [Syntrophotalea carbinolica DSM 2380]|uniref:Cobyric acid synthase n=1 Tax=Syntrophotalea carbinolica (strain DSM 2380 / NBRC 103641 / GraBd1) TaxID=338963 RepID=Q3A7A0_SYNC1|nr:cobyric acid synthase [Syntrophotalea carbinolica]ABA87744.1 L-threonine-0-3-phosphate decarboxylase, cobalt-precorrin-3 C17-methyltransferase and adenosylcobyric acid synthase [Syntrophotalea carbinolica DSM 2380]
MTESGNWRHGGHLRQLAMAAGVNPESLLDFSANINPLGPPEWLRSRISGSISSLVHYPDPEGLALVDAACRRYGVDADEILIGNGSTELFYLLPHALGVRHALIPVPSYVDYATAADIAGLTVHTLPLTADNGFAFDFEILETALEELKGSPVIVPIGHPNNPTGRSLDAQRLRALARRFPTTTFVVDEAFADFVEDFDSLTINRPANVVVMLSLTKIFAIPGLRLGLAVASPALVRKVKSLQPPWSVNTIAQQVGEAALRDAEYIHASRTAVTALRDTLRHELEKIPYLTVYPGQANFLLLRCDRKSMDARTLANRLIKRGLAIRICENFEGLDRRFFRVAVRTEPENRQLVAALRQELFLAPLVTTRRHTPAIMFQGTSSNAGKSVLAAALCRIMLQDGYRVAPFKSQNMSLNSFVTRDGGEMGRAQVVQAQAARLDPDVRMNPILLKPSSETGSQVVLCGKPVGNMKVMDYFRYKAEAFERVKECYDSLASEHDAMVLEGAGSPAEVNLKAHDIVNMKMALFAQAPVLMVGDIDCGGVFASFVGSMEVLSERERAQVAGFIVNRFRGQADLLKDALDYTLQHTGRPILGVVPYVKDLGLPEEDSVGFKEGMFNDTRSSEDAVDIAVLDLPHISNFTDIEPLHIEPDVRIRTVRRIQDLGQPDAVIVPGSKNVIGDLTFLRAVGLDRSLEQLAAEGRCEIIGICGGYQILGRSIDDPHGIESPGTELTGLGLLPIDTVLEQDKTLTRSEARHRISGLKVHGYEIHHGQSHSDPIPPALIGSDGEAMGACRDDGLVWGSYLHGLFDADGFRRWFIDRLRQRKGLKPYGTVQVCYDLEPAFERLADIVRQSIDIPALYRLMGLR